MWDRERKGEQEMGTWQQSGFWTWESHLIFLSLSFFIYKMGKSDSEQEKD